MIPDYLTAAPVGECNRCHRKTWDEENLGTEDRMTQPDGGPCGGTFVSTTTDPKEATT